jgi:4'-phosphopantetheinyl transferase
MILSRYLDVEARLLRFRYGLRGKPAIAEEFGADWLRFNLSHSQEVALYAVAREREVGIDVEYVRPDATDEQIAERFFSPRELAKLQALPVDIRAAALFAAWTRKEAYLKAKGEGLSLALNQFEVSLAPGEPAALVSTPWDPQEAARWSLQALTPGPGYAAALAVEGHDCQLRCWRWADAPGSDACLPVADRDRAEGMSG